MPDSIEYRSLAEFRYQIRRFIRFSEDAARNAGIEPQQHQMMLAIKGLPEGMRPTVRTLAERLQVQHHSAVELIDRLENQSLVERHRSERDRREVMVELTAKGERILRELSLFHQRELRTSGPALAAALKQVIGRSTRAHNARRAGSEDVKEKA